MRLLAVLSTFVCLGVGPAHAQSLGADLPSHDLLAQIGQTMHYVVAPRATVYIEPDGTVPYVQLAFREPVYILFTEGNWSRVRTQDGAHGYVRSSDVSNAWIRVSKRRKRVYLYRGMELLMEVPADFGYNAIMDKEIRGTEANPDHWRTPEGVFFVVRKNPYSKFYKALLLNYPTGEDARRGLDQGLISERQYDAIMVAEKHSTVPPMNTALGGMIEIHGDGTGLSTNWTQGCVAVLNEHLDQLWSQVSVGTPVIIEK